jgi:hypothetical protein
LKNLRWGTHASNEADKLRHGTHNRGERNGRTKLTKKAVLRIVKLRKAGMTLHKIASVVKTNKSTASRILRGIGGWL